MEIIKVSNLSKSYVRSNNPFLRFREVNKHDLNNKNRFKALDNISFSVNSGECVGIIGQNGSGKSTLLKILAGISGCDFGKCDLGGSVSAMLELGVGFNPEYTGRENIYLNGTINGLSKIDTEKSIQKILDFSELDSKFIDMPVKTYSSGMLVRLGFASMIWLNTDIILVDEALAVGDFNFRSKCFKKFEELKNVGKTIIFVSHDVDAVRRFCSRVIWLKNGVIEEDGSVEYVTSRYMQSCVSDMETKNLNETQDTKNDFTSNDFLNRYGSHLGSIKKIQLDCGKKSLIGTNVRVKCVIDVPKCAVIENIGVSLAIKDNYGLDLCVFQTQNTLHIGDNTVTFEFTNLFNEGTYSLAIGLEDKSVCPIKYFEYIEGVAEFQSISNSEKRFGLINLPFKEDIK